MNSISISELNKLAKHPEKLILADENAYADRISKVAERIYLEREARPVVLISGPSGSGKTTSATRIQRVLSENGCTTHTISMDNYFLPLCETEKARDENGNIDFESPLRLDIPLFREHIEKLFACEEIEIPGFDFARQERINGMPLKRGKGDLVILEGIHALNPLVTGDSENFTNCVYVSVRTRLSGKKGETLHPSKIRLMRRLMRDKLYRGRSLAETFEFFKSVERGENLYIMPFKHRANFDIDTFIGYEPLVYRDILLPDLESVSHTYEGYAEFADIERFLKQLSEVDRRFVPDNSLIREFIG
ncbi:MAG: nucleoside kinase [Oscillospiraceae bacterium]|nr:nucleoside kinase [Oscillospiraceae bacterium]